MTFIQPIKRLIPLIVIIVVLITAWYVGLFNYISLKQLQQHHTQLRQWLDAYYWQSLFIFVLIYIVAVAISLPGAVIFTITAGYLFGPILATILVVFSATIGACIIFLAVKWGVGEWLAQKATGWVKRLEQGFAQDAFNYLLSIRLVPIFPFWVINIVPALLNVRLKDFAFATFLGIIPGTFVYVLVGNGLESILAAGKEPNLAIIFEPEIFFPIIGLAVLSIVPLLYKKLKKVK